jgi:lysozyme
MYKDSIGIESIGIGHNLRDKSISDKAVLQIFKDDLQDTINDCKAFDWFERLSDVRQAVILDMVFNMGIAGFTAFTNTIKLLSKGEYNAASIEMLDSLWARQVGNRADALATMMLTNEWPQ